MAVLQQIVFIITLAGAVFLIRRRVLSIGSNIRLGKAFEATGNSGQRFQNMLLVAFGQRKMFKKFIPAFLHFFIYVGFWSLTSKC